jgi:hypothetical protein
VTQPPILSVNLVEYRRSETNGLPSRVVFQQFGFGAELWIGPEKVTIRAVVRTSDPRVGMGLEFVGLKTEDQQRYSGLSPH